MSVRTRPRLLTPILLVPLLLAGAIPSLTAKAQSATSSYESPTYGYEVNWDAEIWTPDEDAVLVAAGPAAIDQILLLHTGGGTLHVVAGQYGYPDAEACVSEEADLLSKEPGVDDYEPLLQNDGAAMAGVEGGIAFGGFQLSYTPTTGEPVGLANFIECRLLPDGAALIFTLIATPNLFEQQMAEAGAVNASLQFAQTDSAATPESETETATVTVDEAWFAAQVNTATAGASDVGPVSGELVQTIGRTALFITDADAGSFYLRARFQNPDAAVDAPWDVGVSFREQSSGEHYRLVFDSAGGWYLSLGVETDLQSGTLTTLATGSGAMNSLELVVVGEVGAFRLNGELVGPLDLSALAGPGQIAIGTAFFAMNTSEGAVTRYRDLQIWPLSAATPATEPAPEEAPAAEPTPEETPEPTPEATTVPTVTAIPEPPPAPSPIAAPTEATDVPTAMPAATVSADQVVIRLLPVNQSGVEGLAILYPEGDRTTVALTMLGASVEEVGAIHAGTCDAFEPLPSYALAIFDEAGRGSSTINVELSALRNAGLVVLLHQSTAEFGNVVACGEIPPE